MIHGCGHGKCRGEKGMTKQSLKRRIERLEKLKQDETTRISVSWRNDGMVEWTLPNGDIELITEAEYKARGGIIVTWQDHIVTKDEREAWKGKE